MAAYIIADVTVTDPKQFAEYHKLSGAAFEAHGIRHRLSDIRASQKRP